MTIFNVFTLMGGIAMFLYGMDLMGKALEQTAGSKLQGILSTMTSSPIRGLLLGMAVTAVIQSSGATTVMAVGFVNSGLMELHQAISVIMGANVGTTVTGWLLSLSGLEGDSFITQMMNPNAWSPILGFIGIWMYMIGKDRKRGVGKIMLGFAILMAGMNTMSHAMSPLADEPWFMDLFLSFKNPILGVIAGAVLTAVLQSSSASVGILQALTSTGAVTYSAAVPIIMGQNIGTTVTALISSAGANKNAKRTAFVHLYFNLIGTIIFLCGFYGLNALIGFSFFADTANTFGIAIVHTVFNVVTTAILLPFNRVLEKLAILTVPDSPADQKQENTLLDDRLLTTPSVAVGRAMLTGSDMAEICRTALLQAMSTTRVWNDAIADEVLRKEDAVDHYEDVLGTYLTIHSKASTAVSDDLIPTGEIVSIVGGPLDFTSPKKLGDDMFAEDHLIQLNGGFDHNFCVEGEGFRKHAEAYEPESGRVMEVWSDLPGVQLFTFNKPDDGLVGKDGKPMQPHTALCLETQFYPDSVHHENFPFQYLQPGVPFSTTTEYRFSVK